MTYVVKEMIGYLQQLQLGGVPICVGCFRPIEGSDWGACHLCRMRIHERCTTGEHKGYLSCGSCSSYG